MAQSKVLCRHFCALKAHWIQFVLDFQGLGIKFFKLCRLLKKRLHQYFQLKEKYEENTNIGFFTGLTLLGLGLIKINELSANFNIPRPSLILNN